MSGCVCFGHLVGAATCCPLLAPPKAKDFSALLRIPLIIIRYMSGSVRSKNSAREVGPGLQPCCSFCGCYTLWVANLNLVLVRSWQTTPLQRLGVGPIAKIGCWDVLASGPDKEQRGASRWQSGIQVFFGTACPCFMIIFFLKIKGQHFLAEGINSIAPSARQRNNTAWCSNLILRGWAPGIPQNSCFGTSEALAGNTKI